MGHDGSIMAGLLVVVFPFVLLLFMMVMERVESPLREVAVENQVEEFLDTAGPAELDTFVREGFSTALARRRTGLSRLLPRSRRPGRHAARAR